MFTSRGDTSSVVTLFFLISDLSVSESLKAKENLNGVELDGRRLRVDYSITKRPHTPTPGVYMGRPTRTQDDRHERGSYEKDRYYDDHYGGGGGGGGSRGYGKCVENFTRAP